MVAVIGYYHTATYSLWLVSIFTFAQIIPTSSFDATVWGEMRNLVVILLRCTG